MKAKTRMDGDKLKGFTIEVEVIESLILSEALTDYAKDRENNVVDRLIALQMSEKMVDAIEKADHKTEPNCSEKPNNCKEEPQTDDLIKQADALIEFEKEWLEMDEAQTERSE